MLPLNMELHFEKKKREEALHNCTRNKLFNKVIYYIGILNVRKKE